MKPTGQVFFWQSGTTIEFDRSQPLTLRKLQWRLKSWAPSRLVWRLCDVFVTGPEAMVDYYVSVGKIDRRKIRVLYNDVDHRRFAMSEDAKTELRRELRLRLGISEDAKIVLFVHRMSPVRRTLRYLPQAIEVSLSRGRQDDCHFLIAGGGDDARALQNSIDALGLSHRVSFTGEVPNMGIEELYACADLFIQPSHAEGFPRVLVEAMVAGLPVVTTNAGGSASLLGPQQQVYVTDKDEPAQFAKALTGLLDREMSGSCSPGEQSVRSAIRYARHRRNV